MPSVSKRQAKLAPAMTINASRDGVSGRRRSILQTSYLLGKHAENSSNREGAHQKPLHHQTKSYFSLYRLDPVQHIMMGRSIETRCNESATVTSGQIS
jgi:hypothetical protein